MPEPKVTPQHLEHDAYLYIRQSTPRQVLENTESTQRQYALRDRAVALGWPLEQIHVLDCDLGKSGSQSAGRDGFQKLVSEVALGKAGLVMGLEVSRLARNSADWHRLIELCSLAGALILDEDGIYDPTNFNDRLLLGLKGTMSEAELHFLKARMRGGMINKARRGELEMRPPVGLVYRDDGVLILDPDAEVQAAIRLVFETFDRTGSAMHTVKLFHEQGLRFPRRLRKGLGKGELHWVRAAHSRILQVLHNPRYAGAFVYGRVRTRRRPDGSNSTIKVPRSDWQFVIPGVHAGYITWEQFEANQKRLAENALGFGGARKAGPAREGPALVQGRVICGVCGERMSVHYSIAYHQLAPTYVCQEASVRRAEKVCQRVPGTVVDQAISNLILELMEPMTLEVALAVQQEVEGRIAETDALRRKHVERAQYEAELARRRYMKVDPDHRLVADSLEAEWNNKLRSLAEAQEQYEQQTQKQRLLIDSQTREQLLSLAADFPQVWNDPSVEHRERKRILRLLVEDVTLLNGERIQVHVRLRGGATRSLTLTKPLPIAQIRKTKPEVVAEIDALLDRYCDREVAEVLNRQGRRTWQNEPFNLKKIAHIRQTFNLKCRYDRLRARGLLTAKEMSVRHGVTTTTINLWAREGRLQKHRYDNLRRCLYEPLDEHAILKGHGGRRPVQPTFTVAQAE
ncbi:MAG TPA: recombinase family protein [Vicinamibacterales bacterium]|jgi:DNA invertase Pin-like site-specific DNA recombinase